MAYRTFETVEAPVPILVRKERVFDPFEMLALRLGAADSVATLRTWPRLARWIELVFGIAPPAPLADPKLESLRRLAVRLRQSSPAFAAAEIASARMRGVSERQIATVAAFVRQLA